MRTIRAAAFVALPTIAPACAAGPNGGRIAVADGHPIAFVSTDTTLTFFVTEDDASAARTAGVTAKAFVRADGRTETVIQTGAAPNRPVGTVQVPLPAGAKVVLSAQLQGHDIQARFEK